LSWISLSCGGISSNLGYRQRDVERLLIHRRGWLLAASALIARRALLLRLLRGLIPLVIAAARIAAGAARQDAQHDDQGAEE
jgi:hypothetical protein